MNHLEYIQDLEPRLYLYRGKTMKFRRVEVRCKCGKVYSLDYNDFTRQESCGCLRIKKMVQRSKTHGLSKTRTYKSWQGMKTRCYAVNDDHYPEYGARGITVCERWLNSFETFLLDMGERPKGKTLDRIDVNGNYEPDNCRWATPKEQARNRRDNHLVMFNGKELPLKQVCEEQQVHYEKTLDRLKRGYSIVDAFKKGDNRYK